MRIFERFLLAFVFRRFWYGVVFRKIFSVRESFYKSLLIVSQPFSGPRCN